MAFDAQFRRAPPIDRRIARDILKDIPLRVSLHPRSTDQVWKVSDARYALPDGIDRLVFVEEGIPYLDEQSVRLTVIT